MFRKVEVDLSLKLNWYQHNPGWNRSGKQRKMMGNGGLDSGFGPRVA